MTRSFRGKVQCPACKTEHTAESGFERWFRNDSGLDSRKDGIVRFDLDILLHRYMTPTDGEGTRDLQAMMFIEVKTHNAVSTPCQVDTLSAFSQMLRNGRPNRYRKRRGLRAEDHTPPARVKSQLLGRRVAMWCYGGHLLRMQGACPVTSEWIEWDNRRITIDQLKKLLAFELNPDTLRPIDWRRRYRAFKAKPVGLFPE